MLKKVTIVLFFLVLVCLALYKIPWTTNVDKTIDGVECRIGDKDYLDNVTISIKGTYKNYLFKNDTFKGTIEIDKYDFTKDGASVLLEFLDDAGALTYFILEMENLNSIH
ncbi:MAG TPA: hypothetical protein VHP81_05815 [Lachnospiraceae bacterium]|nr:hypothetical protein [Lachnospiraceae bacterium]